MRAVYSVRTVPGRRGGVVDAEDWDGTDVDGEGEGMVGLGVVNGGSMSQVLVSPGTKVVSGVAPMVLVLGELKGGPTSAVVAFGVEVVVVKGSSRSHVVLFTVVVPAKSNGGSTFHIKSAVLVVLFVSRA
jgi:hypothetical protein